MLGPPASDSSWPQLDGPQEAKLVHQLQQELSTILRATHPFFSSCDELHSLAAPLHGACTSFARLAYRATAQPSGPMGQLLVSSRVAELALHAVSMLAFAHISASARAACPPLHRSPSLAQLLRGPAVSSLPDTLVPSALAVLHACKQLQTQTEWATSNEPTPSHASPCDGAYTGGANRPHNGACCHAPSTPPTPQQHLSDQLRSPGARIAALLALARAHACLDPEGAAEPADAVDRLSARNLASYKHLTSLANRRRLRKTRRRRDELARCGGWDAKVATKRVVELRAVVGDVAAALHVLVPTPLLATDEGSVPWPLADSACLVRGTATGLSLAAPSAATGGCPGGDAAAADDTTASGAFDAATGRLDDRLLRSICDGPTAATAAFRTLCRAALAVSEDVLWESLVLAADAVKGEPSDGKGAEQQDQQLGGKGQRGWGGGKAGDGDKARGAGGGNSGGPDGSVSLSSAEGEAVRIIYLDFVSSFPAEVALGLLTGLLQGFGPAARAHPASLLGLPLQVSKAHEVADSILDVLTHSVAQLRPPSRHRLVTVLDKPMAGWQEVAAAALLLLSRTGCWMQGQAEAEDSQGSCSCLMLQSRPEASSPRAMSSVWLASHELRQLQVHMLRLVRSFLGDVEAQQAEPQQADAGGGAAAAAAAAVPQAPAAQQARGASQEDRETEWQLLALLPRLLEGLAALAATARHSTYLCLSGRTDASEARAARDFLSAAATVRKVCLTVEGMVRKWSANPAQQLELWSEVAGSSGSWRGPTNSPADEADPVLLLAASVRQLAAAADALVQLGYILPRNAQARELSRMAAALTLPVLCEMGECLADGWSALNIPPVANEPDTAAEERRQQQQPQPGRSEQQQGLGADLAESAAAPSVPWSAAGVGTAAWEWRAHGVMSACRKVLGALTLALCPAAEKERQLVPWEARLAVSCKCNMLVPHWAQLLNQYRFAKGLMSEESDAACWGVDSEVVAQVSSPSTSDTHDTGETGRAAEAAAEECQTLATHACILARTTLQLIPAPGQPSSGAGAAEHAERCLVAGFWATDVVRWGVVGALSELAAHATHVRQAFLHTDNSDGGDVPLPTALPVAAVHLSPLLRALWARLAPLARAVIAGGAGLAEAASGEHCEKLMAATAEAWRCTDQVQATAALLLLSVCPCLRPDGSTAVGGMAASEPTDLIPAPHVLLDELRENGAKAADKFLALGNELLRAMVQVHECLDYRLLSECDEAANTVWWPAWLEPWKAGARVRAAGQGQLRKLLAVEPAAIPSGGRQRCKSAAAHASGGGGTTGAPASQAQTSASALLVHALQPRLTHVSLGAMLRAASSSVKAPKVCYWDGCLTAPPDPGKDDGEKDESGWCMCPSCGVATYCCVTCYGNARQWHADSFECAVLHGMQAAAAGT